MARRGFEQQAAEGGLWAGGGLRYCWLAAGVGWFIFGLRSLGRSLRVWQWRHLSEKAADPSQGARRGAARCVARMARQAAHAPMHEIECVERLTLDSLRVSSEIHRDWGPNDDYRSE